MAHKVGEKNATQSKTTTHVKGNKNGAIQIEHQSHVPQRVTNTSCKP
jgi:hypothetical protein